MALIFTSFSLLLTAGKSQKAERIWVKNSIAKCLDGSQAAFYYRPGSAGNTTVVFFLEGGGLCSHQDDCQARAGTDLGSSKNFGPSTVLGSFQSADAKSNPAFYEAHQVFVPYCTGDLHGGTRALASKDTWGLHFSGHLNMISIIEQLKQDYDLGSAGLVVLAGGSAGGIGVFYNVDAVAALLPGVPILGVPIGGFLFPHANYNGPDAARDEETARPTDFEHDAALFHLVPARKGGACASALGPDLGWQCSEPSTLYTYVQTPLLIIEAQTDSVIMFAFSDAVYENIPEAIAYGQTFRANSTALAKAVAKNAKDRIFSPCCFMHTNFDRGSPTISGLDYYDLLVQAAHDVQSGATQLSGKSLVDGCDGFQCSTACPQYP